MENYLFISYSSHDKTIADAICHFLEDNSIPCWVAPRDILPGENWASSIIKAIRNCSAMLLIYSKNSNKSGHVANEVDKAFSNGKPIIPFMIDQTPLNDEFDYYLSRKHWLVAYPDYKMRFIDLLKVVSKVVLPYIDSANTETQSIIGDVSENGTIDFEEIELMGKKNDYCDKSHFSSKSLNLSFFEEAYEKTEKAPNHKFNRNTSEKSHTRNIPSSEVLSDVFISYSPKDKETAQRLAIELNRRALKVLMNLYDVTDGGTPMSYISKAISETKIFIPILSHNVEMESMERQEYRREWMKAIEIDSYLFRSNFISPLVQVGFDIYNTKNRIPEKFMCNHLNWYKPSDSFEDFASFIKYQVDQLTNNEI